MVGSEPPEPLTPPVVPAAPDARVLEVVAPPAAVVEVEPPDAVVEVEPPDAVVDVEPPDAVVEVEPDPTAVVEVVPVPATTVQVICVAPPCPAAAAATAISTDQKLLSCVAEARALHARDADLVGAGRDVPGAEVRAGGQLERRDVDHRAGPTGRVGVRGLRAGVGRPAIHDEQREAEGGEGAEGLRVGSGDRVELQLADVRPSSAP